MLPKRKRKLKVKTRRVKDWHTRSERDMRMFFRTVDWSELWQEFYAAKDASGASKYKTIREFVAAHGKNHEQRNFMRWYLGRKENQTEEQVKTYSFVAGGPVDWMEQRENGGWFRKKNLVMFSAEIRRRLHALDALRQAGNECTLNSLVRAEQLAQQLDEEFQGRFFLPTLDAKQNEERARLYVGLHERLLNLKAQAQDLYAKSHGVNFDDMQGLVQLMSAMAMRADIEAPADKKETVQAAAVRSLVEMTMAKAARFNLPLPVDAEQTILDAIPVGKTKAN